MANGRELIESSKKHGHYLQISHSYVTLIGSLKYLALGTRPDITSYAVQTR